GSRRDGAWLVGAGVAASTYPTYRQPSAAVARVDGAGEYVVAIAAADIGTGARTALTQIAADALEAPLERVRVEIGDTALPRATVAGGSKGTASWGWAVDKACRALRAALDEREGVPPPGGLEASADTTEDIAAQPPLSRHAFG